MLQANAFFFSFSVMPGWREMLCLFLICWEQILGQVLKGNLRSMRSDNLPNRVMICFPLLMVEIVVSKWIRGSVLSNEDSNQSCVIILRLFLSLHETEISSHVLHLMWQTVIQMLDDTAERFFGVQRRNPMGMFGDIFKVTTDAFP